MHYQGICHKMHASLGLTTDQSSSLQTLAHVQYKLILDAIDTGIQDSLGQVVQINWTGRIFCISCGSKTPKSYAQGHCFKCFKTKAACDLCVLKPETCHYHLGTCREDEFAQTVCFQPHQVYLANSSGLKVGITRLPNVPTRWLDQGATQALPLLQVASRRLSGLVEVMFAQHIDDKTDWRKLLKGEATPIDLIAQSSILLKQFAEQLGELAAQYPVGSIQPLTYPMQQFVYPVLQYPNKVVSYNLDKTPVITDRLLGIKGQYLIFDRGVVNIRKYTGYELQLTC